MVAQPAGRRVPDGAEAVKVTLLTVLTVDAAIHKRLHVLCAAVDIRLDGRHAAHNAAPIHADDAAAGAPAQVRCLNGVGGVADDHPADPTGEQVEFPDDAIVAAGVDAVATALHGANLWKE